MPRYSFSLGPATIRIQGSGNLYAAIIANFASFAVVDNSSQADLCFTILEIGEPHTSQGGSSAKDGDGTLQSPIIKVKGFTLLMEQIQAGNRSTINIECRPWQTKKRRLLSLLPRPLQRLASMRYVTALELQALDFIFHVYLWTTQLALLEHRATYIHASTMYNDSSRTALLISGWGGVGKTSLAAFAYVESDNKWGFLSDDLSIIDSQGMVWPNELAIHYYPYNLRGFNQLTAKLQGLMGPVDRQHWRWRTKIFGSSGVVRRIDPQMLWGVEKESHALTRALFLERWPRSEPRTSVISLESFVDKSIHILLHELKTILTPIIISHASADTDLQAFVPSISSFISRTAAVLTSACKNSVISHIFVPASWGPMELGGYVFNSEQHHAEVQISSNPDGE